MMPSACQVSHQPGPRYPVYAVCGVCSSLQVHRNQKACAAWVDYCPLSLARRARGGVSSPPPAQKREICVCVYVCATDERRRLRRWQQADSTHVRDPAAFWARSI